MAGPEWYTPHLNLRGSARSGGDAVQVELAQLVVVLGHGALTLKDLRAYKHTHISICMSRLTA